MKKLMYALVAMFIMLGFAFETTKANPQTVSETASELTSGDVAMRYKVLGVCIVSGGNCKVTKKVKQK
ncbi:MAG: hypothetical protein LAT68_00635 [Cyclobacteriaceae bacterium]|nr:hypothetical protein [Cyclobacteriaceae bacterium]MCH8514809.1 hypothetical protein [Cyclobacteriaceae bacterium]